MVDGYGLLLLKHSFSFGWLLDDLMMCYIKLCILKSLER
jgi:hypothetical protein